MKDQPLRCTIEDEKLIISIGIDTLAFAAKEHPFFWSGEDDKTPCINVTDNAMFAKEVALALQHEAEDGSTLITRVIDKAMQDAVEDGCYGVEHV